MPSPLNPKNRQKLMIRGRQRAGSMRGSGSPPTNNLSSTCSYRMCGSNTLALTFLPKGRKSWTTPSILYRTLAHARWRGQSPDRSERGHAEFVRFIAIAHLRFFSGTGLLPVVSASRSTWLTRSSEGRLITHSACG